MADPLPKYARVDPQNPEAWAQCDRCGFWYNRSDLGWQYEWGGMQMYNTGVLLCLTGNRCYDIPQEQFRTIILPPDPPPIVNARVPNFDYEEQTVMIYQFAGPTISGVSEYIQLSPANGWSVASSPQSPSFIEVSPAPNWSVESFFTPSPTPAPQTLSPPWGAGPQLEMCNQSGTQVFVLQYLTSS